MSERVSRSARYEKNIKIHRHNIDNVEMKGEMTHPTTVTQVASAFCRTVFLPDFQPGVFHISAIILMQSLKTYLLIKVKLL